MHLVSSALVFVRWQRDQFPSLVLVQPWLLVARLWRRPHVHVPRGLLDQLERGLLVLQRRELLEPRKLSVVHPLRRQQVFTS